MSSASDSTPLKPPVGGHTQLGQRGGLWGPPSESCAVTTSPPSQPPEGSPQAPPGSRLCGRQEAPARQQEAWEGAGPHSSWAGLGWADTLRTRSALVGRDLKSTARSTLELGQDPASCGPCQESRSEENRKTPGSRGPARPAGQCARRHSPPRASAETWPQDPRSGGLLGVGERSRHQRAVSPARAE